MSQSRRIFRFRNAGILSLLLMTLCLISACTDDVRTAGQDGVPQSTEPVEQQTSDAVIAAGIPDGSCQPTGQHCRSGNHLFAPLNCGGGGSFSGYVCGTCIPSGFCQPTGDHCCSTRHSFGADCFGVIDGKQYSGYGCLP